MYMDYDFWFDLMGDFKAKKIEIIAKETHRQSINESVFGIYSDDHRTYMKITRSFQSLMRKHFEKLLSVQLNQIYPGRVTILKSSCFNIFVDNGFEKRLIALKTSPHSVSSESIKKMVEEQLKIDRFVRVDIIFLQEESLENSMACQEFQWKASNIGNECFQSYLFNEYMKTISDMWNSNLFNHELEDFKEKLYQLIGYQLTMLCSPENWEKFKTDLKETILTYNYDEIKVIQNNKMMGKRKTRSKIIRENSYNLVKGTFLISERYRLLLGSQNFAQSFMTSEWLYENYIPDEKLDKTYVVSGYLKSMEQLLWDIIYLVGQGERLGKNNEIISESNRDTIDSTLGSLETFLTKRYQSKDLFLDAFGSNRAKQNVMDYLQFQLADWRRKQRNGYFHKHNLERKEIIDEIRNETIYLYMLILGSLELSSDKMEQLL